MRAPPLSDNWAPTIPAETLARYRDAWEAHRSCRDCKWWDYDESDGDGIGVCGAFKAASLMAPEDYTCDDFEAKPISK